ncbi:uncharacterized protein LOC136043944 isoform X3 [Artemia franciscana]|uniref:Uncharacterized protein n=1 Tax=Artemia franciscana TaxID=6661 RepID=A0AA88HSY7_ARTSF|nr:hypothetical protein QYM36_010003 [Artemia franciscana]
MCITKAFCYCLNLRNGVIVISLLTLFAGGAMLFLPFTLLYEDPSLCIISTVSICANLIMALVLFLGGWKKALGAVRIYVILQALHIILLTAFEIVLIAWVCAETFVYGKHNAYSYTVDGILLVTLPLPVVIGVLSYFWFIALSYFKCMREKEAYTGIDL